MAEEYIDEDEILEEDRGDEISEEGLDEEGLDEEGLDEEGLDEEGLDEEDSDDSNIKIPKSRLDEVIAQREEERERARWLEEQLEKLIEANSKPSSQHVEEKEVVKYDFDTAEQNYIDLIIEGETSKAAALRKEIEEARHRELVSVIKDIESESSKKIKEASKQTTEDLKFESLIDTFESKYAFLNADSDDYNEEAVDTVNTLMAGFIASGISKPDALSKAVRKVAPFYKNEEETVKKLGGERKTKSIKKSVKASKSQPPKTRSKGSKNLDLDDIDISKLNERDFDSLTEKEKRILRGD